MFFITTLLLSCLLSIVAAETYNFSNVANHSSARDCWVVVSSYVLDITPFVQSHPQVDITNRCGTDITTEFFSVHDEELFESFRIAFEIGTISGSDSSNPPPPPPPPPYQPTDDGYDIYDYYNYGDVTTRSPTNSVDSSASTRNPTRQPTKNPTRVYEMYTWVTEDFDECEDKCGLDSHELTRDVYCSESSNRKVSDSLCNASFKPTTKKLCPATPACGKYKWKAMGYFPECPTACGYRKITYNRAVKCYDNTEKEYTEESACVEAGPVAGPRPPSTLVCSETRPCDNYTWRMSGFEDCPKQCGYNGGFIYRVVECIKNETGDVVKDGYCKDEMPVDSYKCNETAPCPTAQPTYQPTTEPTFQPTTETTFQPTLRPTNKPTMNPTIYPTSFPTISPTDVPTVTPTVNPTAYPTIRVSELNPQVLSHEESILLKTKSNFNVCVLACVKRVDNNCGLSESSWDDTCETIARTSCSNASCDVVSARRQYENGEREQLQQVAPIDDPEVEEVSLENACDNCQKSCARVTSSVDGSRTISCFATWNKSTCTRYGNVYNQSGATTKFKWCN